MAIHTYRYIYITQPPTRSMNVKSTAELLRDTQEVTNELITKMGVPLERFIPTGSAIQQLRSKLADPYRVNHELTTDELHPLYSLPYLATQLTSFISICSNYFEDLNMNCADGITWSSTQVDSEGIEMYIGESEVSLAKECASTALCCTNKFPSSI